MEPQQIFDFLTSGNAERVTGMVFAFLAAMSGASVFIYYMARILLDFLKRFLDLFKITINKKETIIEIPKYITPPENKEMDKYLTILKKIVDEYEKKNLKLE